MKHKGILLLILTTMCLRVSAQSFEGTVKWSMKMEITDPEKKAKMESAQQKMNDPANQAKMKEMEAKMNDPQFKAMMEANPQMKAQMENMKKMSEGGMGGMMPTGMTVKVKGTSTLTKMDGGMMNGMEILHQKDKPSIRIDRANKTWSAMPGGNGQMGKEGMNVTSKVTKTGETATILGYNCTKYIMETSDRGRTITQNIWTTTDIKDMDMKSLARQRGPGGRPFFSDQIDGVPLKIEATTEEGKMVMEVTEIKRESINAADMTVPADYKETKMGMGMGMN